MSSSNPHFDVQSIVVAAVGAASQQPIVPQRPPVAPPRQQPQNRQPRVQRPLVPRVPRPLIPEGECVICLMPHGGHRVFYYHIPEFRHWSHEHCARVTPTCPVCRTRLDNTRWPNTVVLNSIAARQDPLPVPMQPLPQPVVQVVPPQVPDEEEEEKDELPNVVPHTDLQVWLQQHPLGGNMINNLRNRGVRINPDYPSRDVPMVLFGDDIIYTTTGSCYFMAFQFLFLEFIGQQRFRASQTYTTLLDSSIIFLTDNFHIDNLPLERELQAYISSLLVEVNQMDSSRLRYIKNHTYNDSLAIFVYENRQRLCFTGLLHFFTYFWKPKGILFLLFIYIFMLKTFTRIPVSVHLSGILKSLIKYIYVSVFDFFKH
jgi:hypothetical protein